MNNIHNLIENKIYEFILSIKFYDISFIKTIYYFSIYPFYKYEIRKIIFHIVIASFHNIWFRAYE